MKLFFTILFLSISILLQAQGDVKFYAESDAKQVVIGRYFEVDFILTNADGDDFRPPSFKDFDILSGPNQAISSSSVNGRWSRELRLSYTLQPKRVGKFNIGSATIKVKGKQMKSFPIPVEVLKGKSGAKSQADLQKRIEEQVFIRAVASTDTAYIGQQILVDYKLYTTLNVETYNLLGESEYPGFFVKDIRRFNSRVVREVIDGVQYSTKVLKRVVLFPQQGGLMTVDPLEIQLAINTDESKQSRRRSFFDQVPLTRIVAKTDPLELKIRPLPANAPESFTGAVGKFSMITTSSSPSISTDDVITIKMIVVGDGDVKQIQPPPIAVSDSLEVYEPRILTENSKEENGVIKSEKKLEYLLLPKEPGSYTVVPKYTYFDTDSLQYITIASSPLRFNVRKGVKKRADIKLPSDRDSVYTELRALKSVSGLKKKGTAFIGSPIYWSLLGLPLFLLGIVMFRRRKELKAGNIDITLLKKQKAAAVAKKNLEAAQQFLDNKESRSFYNEVSRASLGYIGDKLNIPLSELSKANIEGQLQKLKISAPRVEAFIKILKTCEMALYGGMDNVAAMQETYDTAATVISGIEEEIGQ